MILKSTGSGSAPVRTINMRCPACRHLGAFTPYPSFLNDLNLVYVQDGQVLYRINVGYRKCPNTQCNAHVFVACREEDGKLIVSYPPERIDFNTDGVPANIVKALEEAITCHSNECYTSAAIMVRKTLEELCHSQGAIGDNLKKRIEGLQAKVLLPPELFSGLDDLRLLGNDAAHIESQVFNQVSKEEVEIGIEFTKEILKAVYQYIHLANRLKGLKKTT